MATGLHPVRNIGIGLLLVGAFAAAVTFIVSEIRLSRRFSVQSEAIEIPDDPASRARGEYLVNVVSQCTTCHAADLAGQEIVDDLWFGTLWAPNLTDGRGGIADFNTDDLERSIRHGVKRDGKSVLMMPAQNLQHLSDSDLGSILAYLRSLDPIDRESPAPIVGVFSRLAIALGIVPDLLPAGLVAHGARAEPTPARETIEYGQYLVEAANCRVCHNAQLTGGLHPLALPDEPEPPNLTRGGSLANWTSGDFVRALRTGRTRDGRELDPSYMPWPAYSEMTDLELRAIWKYLETLPPLPGSGRSARHSVSKSRGRYQT